jgi:hypothetical protein
MLRLRLLLPTMLVWLVASQTAGSCGLRPYAFRGIVRRQCGGAVVADAQVFVFMDDQDGTFSAGATTRYPDFFRTDKRGRFKASAWFDTFTSYDPATGHRCDRTPSRVEVIVTRPKFLSKRVLLDLASLTSVKEGDVQVFEVPAIELEPCQRES